MGFQTAKPFFPYQKIRPLFVDEVDMQFRHLKIGTVAGDNFHNDSVPAFLSHIGDKIRFVIKIHIIIVQ